MCTLISSYIFLLQSDLLLSCKYSRVLLTLTYAIEAQECVSWLIQQYAACTALKPDKKFREELGFKHLNLYGDVSKKSKIII